MTGLSDETLAHLRRVVEWPEPGERYRVHQPIGQGGMGTVYLAEDRLLAREVALKVVRADLLDPGATERIEREARILSRLEHPGIVPVHDVGILADGRVYYVMKLVRGVRLDQFAREATLSELLRAFLRVCETVGFAHAHGVVHRDLKPSNVMIGAFGEVLVLDWGIARVRGLPEPARAGAPADPGTSPMVDLIDTLPGTVLGTPGFMPPEQALGQTEQVDERSDVFALGAILRDVLQDRPPSQPVPRPLQAIWNRALALDPANRYPGAAALAEDVARFLDSRPVLAYKETPLELAVRLYQKYQTPILLVLAYLTMRLLFLVARGL